MGKINIKFLINELSIGIVRSVLYYLFSHSIDIDNESNWREYSEANPLTYPRRLPTNEV